MDTEEMVGRAVMEEKKKENGGKIGCLMERKEMEFLLIPIFDRDFMFLAPLKWSVLIEKSLSQLTPSPSYRIPHPLFSLYLSYCWQQK